MSTELATQQPAGAQPVSATHQLAAFLGITPNAMLETFKAQCFRSVTPDRVSDAQLAAFVSVANAMEVNPLLPGMLYAYPDGRGGIVPMMGPDGVYKKLSDRKDVDYWETTVYPEDVTQPPTHAVSLIHCTNRSKPFKYEALLSEWKVGSNPNWQTRPRHMLQTRAIKQCARQVIHGIPFDEDEREIMGLRNVTGTGDQDQPQADVRPPAPEKAKGVAAAKTEAAAATTTAASPATEKKAETTRTAAPKRATAPTVEAEFTEQGQQQAQASTPPPAEKKAEPAKAAAPAATTAPATPRSTLKDKETLTTTASVVEFVAKDMNKQPSMLAEIKSAEFAGQVYHLGGKDNPAWQLQKPITVTLTGRALKGGNVIAVVEQVSIAEAGSESSGDDLDFGTNG